MKAKILSDFKNTESTLKDCQNRVFGLIKDLLDNAGIHVHKLESRVKQFDSLSKKIDEKNKYSSLSEITDIIGIRIIAFLESDVDQVEVIIKSEFEIDEENSIDKRQLKSDQFGYRSLHIVAELNEERCSLSEYKKYKEQKFEIQIRSVLQHAWAEIEHDLGYKSKASIPEEYRRDFNRLAALLETADLEFDRLKNSLKEYEENVSELIRKEPENVPIDQASLRAFILADPTFEEARNFLRKRWKCIFDHNISSLDDFIMRFEFFEVKNIQQLRNLVESDSKDFLNFVKIFLSDGIDPNLAFELPIYWFQHFLAAKTMDKDFVDSYRFYGRVKIGGESQDFIDKYKESKK